MKHENPPLDVSPGWEYPNLGICQALEVHAKCRGAELAFTDDLRAVSWRELAESVCRVTHALHRLGVVKGDRVALLTGPSVWAYEAWLGVVRSGAVVTPLSTLLPPQLIARLLRDSGATVLMVGDDYESQAAEAARMMDEPLHLISQSRELEGAQAFSDFWSDCPVTRPGNENVASDRFTIIYSSGTTGVPKGIVHTHQGRMGFATQIGQASGVTPRSRVLLTTPPYSNGTMIFLLPALCAGASVRVMSSFEPERFLEIAGSEKPTHAFLVPTQFKALRDTQGISKAGFDSFRCLLTAGSPMPSHLKQWFMHNAGHALHELWGLTEGVATFIYPDEIAQRPDSIGRSLPHTDITLIDSSGNELEAPATGEIVGRSSMLMEGYWRRPDANREACWHDGRGIAYLRTGDIGEMDSQGYLTLRGRIKEMIISGGFNVYPVDLEAVLMLYEGVDDAVVVGVADERWGEVPIAFVRARSHVQLDIDELQDWANAQLAKHQRLADIVLSQADFPRNALGKVLKTELQKAYGQGES